MEKDFIKVSSKGQIVIPKEFRKDLKIKEGTILEMIGADKFLILKKIERRPTKEELRIIERLKARWKEIEGGKYKTYTKKEFKRKLLEGKL